jgi:hypothetical protein
MHTHQWTTNQNTTNEVSIFVVPNARASGCVNIWKVLNNPDRSSLSDTGERVVVMKKELLNTRVGMVELITQIV